MPWRRLVFLALAVVLALAAGIAFVGLRDEIATADVIVVPGNTVLPDGRPSPRLQARLEAALRLYRDRRAPLVFVSGGMGREGRDEATAMARYLLARGVPAAAIVQDHHGDTTAATARHAAAFLLARQQHRALVATQYFHVARTVLALAQRGIVVTGHVHARYSEWRDAYSLAREVPGLIVYFIRD